MLFNRHSLVKQLPCHFCSMRGTILHVLSDGSDFVFVLARLVNPNSTVRCNVVVNAKRTIETVIFFLEPGWIRLIRTTALFLMALQWKLMGRQLNSETLKLCWHLLLMECCEAQDGCLGGMVLVRDAEKMSHQSS